MGRVVAPALLVLGACQGDGVAGDWAARTLVHEGGEAVAVGVLEIDRDGETLLRVDAAGDGFGAALTARGSTELDASEGVLSLVGDLDGQAERVAVSGVCVADGAELLCDVDVGAAAWSLVFTRERDALGD